jgi:alpha-glucosidase
VFLFGSDFLVAPKVWDFTTPYNVQFPPGEWYDYWSSRQLKDSATVAPSLDQLPVYFRPGAIIPQGPVVQSMAQVPNGPLDLRVYLGPDCHGSLYLDDGNTFNYEKGVFLRQDFSCAAQQGSVSVQLAPAQGSYIPWWHQVELTIYGVSVLHLALHGFRSSVESSPLRQQAIDQIEAPAVLGQHQR